MRIHKIQAGEIYIVLFIQYKRKTPTSIILTKGSYRSQGFSGGGYSLYLQNKEETIS